MASERVVGLIFRLWSGFYDRPIFQKTFYRRVHKALLRTLDAEPVRVAVDLGCGTAQLTADLAERYPVVIGADLSHEMLRAAQRRLGSDAPPLVRANVYALPFRDGSVDLLTVTISYHFYLEPQRALAEIRRVLRPGGRFVLAALVGPISGTGSIMRLDTPQKVRHELERAGFVIESAAPLRPVVRIYVARR